MRLVAEQRDDAHDRGAEGEENAFHGVRCLKTRMIRCGCDAGVRQLSAVRLAGRPSLTPDRRETRLAHRCLGQGAVCGRPEAGPGLLVGLGATNGDGCRTVVRDRVMSVAQVHVIDRFDSINRHNRRRARATAAKTTVGCSRAALGCVTPRGGCSAEMRGRHGFQYSVRTSVNLLLTLWSGPPSQPLLSG